MDDPACVFSEECNGVFVYCKNNNVGGGADESGGDDGPAPNYWWVPYDGVVPNPVALCVENAGDEADVCCVEGCGVAPGCCFVKQYDEPGNGVALQFGNTIRVCLGDSTPVAGVDPLVDWASGSYPGFDDSILAQCSTRCGNLHNGQSGQDAQAVCEDENWSGLQTRPSWEPDEGYNCLVGAEINKDDPDGSGVPWHLVGGPSTPVPLDCDLTGDCVDWFYPTVAAFVLTPGAGTFIEPETRAAHFVGVENGGSGVALNLNMSGSGSGVDEEEPIFGMAEYTAIDCGDDVCPFFLANLSAYNMVDSWQVRLDTDISSRILKSVSEVEIDLMQSTLGVRHMGLDKVAFAPGALQLRVQAKITAQGTNSTYGDGTRAVFVENTTYVFADYDDGALTLTHSFPVQSGTGTLTLDVVPDEYPPMAEHDLASTEACDAGTGHKLSSHLLSSDPDDDIVLDLWWIDGVPCSGACVVPLGSHQVALEARDARGAIHRTAEQWVYVTTPCS